MQGAPGQHDQAFEQGHQGLSRFVDDFPRFNRAIEEYVQRDHQRELVDVTMTIVPGINFLPWDVFAFIDESIDRISRRRRERGGEAGDACTRPLCRGLLGRKRGEKTSLAPRWPPQNGGTKGQNMEGFYSAAPYTSIQEDVFSQRTWRGLQWGKLRQTTCQDNKMPMKMWESSQNSQGGQKCVHGECADGRDRPRSTPSKIIF